MFENVLVGVDFRPSGQDAIALASRLAGADASIALAHVYPGVFMPSHAVTPGLVAEDRERAERQLEQERSAAGIEAELLVRQAPSAGQGLHELAEERGADLIVLGSCHRGAFGRAMLGDDTRASLNGAPCAVAVAPGGYAEEARALATIGVAYDGSPESELALRAARSLGATTHAAIRALHIVTLPSYAYVGTAPAVAADVTKIVEQAEAEIGALDGVEGRAEYGLPSQDLATFGKEVDLLVVGSRGYGPWGRLVHGSTSNALARHARSPLLIVPRGAAPREDGAGDRVEAQAAVA